MEENKDLGTEAVESPSTVEANVEQNEGTNLYEDFWNKDSDAPVASESETEVQEQDLVEPVDSQNEGMTDENSGYTNSGSEAEELSKEDEIDHAKDKEEVEPEGRETVDYDELMNYNLEFDGKLYSPEDIKSILGQENAAGTKSREASEALKDIEAQRSDLAEREANLTKHTDAVRASDEMFKMQSEGREINALIEEAEAIGNMYEVIVQERKLKKLKSAYLEAEVQVKEQRKEQIYQQDIEREATAVARLNEMKMGYLLEDNNPSSIAWSKYVSDKMPGTDPSKVARNPYITAAFEKARKWDKAHGNESKKLKTSDKTLKAGSGESASSRKSNEEIAAKSRLSQGRGTKADIKNVSSRVAKGFWDK